MTMSTRICSAIWSSRVRPDTSGSSSGQGHLARQLSSYEGVDDEDADANSVTIDEDGYRTYRDCYRPPYLFKGRSYMYGLPDGVVPQAPCQ